LTSSDGTPRWESVNDAANPEGPPPTINTGVSLRIPIPSLAWLADPTLHRGGHGFTVDRKSQTVGMAVDSGGP
jgi:hypothetical protein